MPLFAVTCRDRKDSLPVRMENRPAHLDYLDRTGVVRLAGPLLEDGSPAGSLIVIEAEDMKAAQGWAAADPYAAAGLFDSVTINEWKKVIG